MGNMGTKRKKRGRKAASLKIDGDWETAVTEALRKKKPMTGWPPLETPAKAKKKRKRKKA